MPQFELVAKFPAFCRRCHSRLCLTLCMLTISAWLLPSAEAQPAPSLAADQSGSHRRLPLPSNGTPDLQQQMFLMKQLKALLSGQSATPPGKSSDDPSAAGNAEQSRVQDALKTLKDKLPPELRPMLDNVPPALVEQAMSDPAIKEQMKQVLEQYSKSRQIPEGNSQNGSRLPLPPNGPRPSDASSGDASDSQSSAPERSGRAESTNPADRSSQPPQPAPGNPPANRNSDRAPSPASPGRSGGLQQPQSAPDSQSSQGNLPQPQNPTGEDSESQSNAGSKATTEPLSQPETPKPPNGAAESALQKLRELWNRQLNNNNNPETPSGSSNSPNAAQRGLPSSGDSRMPGSSPQDSFRQQGSSQQRRPGTDGNSSQRPDSADVADGSNQNESPDEWDRRLENLIRQQRGEPPLPPPSAGTSPGVAPNAASGEPGGNGDTADIANRGIGKPSVAEFLELMQGVVPTDPQPRSNSEAPAPNDGEASGSPSDASERERLAEQVRRKQEDAKQDLQQLGLQETLKKIVKGAKKEAQQQQIAAQQRSDAAEKDNGAESPTNETSGGLSESMLKALGGISQDLIEIVKDARFKPADDQKQSGGSERVTAEPAEPSAARSLLNNLRDTTTELLADIEEPPAPRASPTADDVPPELAVPTSLADLVARWLLPVLLLSVLLLLLLWRSGVIAPSSIGGGAMSRVTEEDVQSKADVVRAFHRMALQPTRATQHWWTHQMVADDIREASPDKDEQVRILTRLYEQARYLPEDVDFTPEQIREAQSALKRCET